MGGCATKPKDLETEQAPAPAEAPAPAVPQENKDAGETKKEEPLVDVSEPAPVKEVTTTAEEKPATKDAVPAVESKPAETKVEAVVETKDEKKVVVETSAGPQTPAPAVAEVSAPKSDKIDAPAKS